MNEDMISNGFAESINKDLIRRNIKLLWAILILYSAYTIATIIDWCLLIAAARSSYHNLYTVYTYRIMPLISLVNLGIGFFIWYHYIKGYRLILLSFEKENADLFNEGYACLNKVSVLNIIGYSIILLNLATRLGLKYLF